MAKTNVDKKKRCVVYSTDQNTQSKIFVSLNGKQLYLPQGEMIELESAFINLLRGAVEQIPATSGGAAELRPRFVVQEIEDVVTPSSSTPEKPDGL